MSKITLTNLVNLTNQTTAVNAINANNAVLTTALDNTLSRDGTTPNTMSASLDMNSNRILNLPVPVNQSEPLRLQDVTTFTEFQNSVSLAAALAAGAASATAAAGSATSAATSATNSATSATNSSNSAAAAAASAASITAVQVEPLSFADALVATIPTTLDVVHVDGYTVVGDGPTAPYVSRLSEPAHVGKFLSNGVWRELERHDGVYLEDFGAEQSNTPSGTDLTKSATTALADCIDYCFRKQRGVIRVNSGVWRLTSKAPVIPVGISLVGHGHSSSFRHGGSSFLLDYDGTLPGSTGDFHWNGSGTAFNSTGGGMRNLSIWRQIGRHGGALIRLSGINDSNRPGYMHFRDLFLGATGTGTCDYCIIHDGSPFVTSGSQGIRDILWDGIWLSGADVETAQFINATHTKINAMQVSQGTGAVTPIVRITGATSAALDKTTDLQATNLSVSGNLIVANADHCVITGAASTLTVDTNNLTSSRILGIWDARKNAGGSAMVAADFDTLRSAHDTMVFGYGTAF